MDVSVCIPTLKTKHDWVCAFEGLDVEFLYSNLSGIGASRKQLADRASGKVLVMMDDDVFISETTFRVLVSVTEGHFFMTKISNHVSSRVFSINKCDYDRTCGFDGSIRFVFEDGAFYCEALKAGLKCSFLSSKLVKHLEHTNRLCDGRKYFSWFEHGKMFVCYKHFVYSGLVGFFGFRSMVKHPDVFVTKFFSVLYWILRSSYR